MNSCNNCKYETMPANGYTCGSCDVNCSNWEPKIDNTTFVELWKKFINRELVVNCKTEEEAIKFLAYCEKKGLKWFNGNKPTEYTRWSKYKEKTCYSSIIDFGLYECCEKITYSEMFQKEKKEDIQPYSLPRIIVGLKVDNSRKFQRLSDGLIITVDSKGNLVWESGHKKLNLMSDKFRLIQESLLVSFQEAIEALNSGKTIECKFNGLSYLYESNALKLLINTNGAAITCLEILKGKWFIK